jgi:phosphoribosylaminoimidazole-succinocarboxamide synthase
MQKGSKIYEGKAKEIFSTDDGGLLWVAYKDSVTAFNGEKKDTMPGKGRLNNEISSMLFGRLKEKGMQSHFVKKLSDTEQLVKKVDIIPLEVVVRNIIAGSIAKRLGLEEGRALETPIVEFFYKNDSLNDPLVTCDHIRILGIAGDAQVKKLREMALAVNMVLGHIFKEAGITLVDFKLEFGTDGAGNILLADEISPDTCRLWDTQTGQKLDKDVYRRNLGDMLPGYEAVLERLLRV